MQLIMQRIMQLYATLCKLCNFMQVVQVMQVMQNQIALSTDIGSGNHLVNAFRRNEWNAALVMKLPRPSP